MCVFACEVCFIFLLVFMDLLWDVTGLILFRGFNVVCSIHSVYSVIQCSEVIFCSCVWCSVCLISGWATLSLDLGMFYMISLKTGPICFP